MQNLFLSMIVAPAGYGKTYAIALCLSHTKGKQLILTHTNAGVASLKEKIMQQGINNKHYRVETITGFAQKYVNNMLMLFIVVTIFQNKRMAKFIILL